MGNILFKSDIPFSAVAEDEPIAQNSFDGLDSLQNKEIQMTLAVVFLVVLVNASLALLLSRLGNEKPVPVLVSAPQSPKLVAPVAAAPTSIAIPQVATQAEPLAGVITEKQEHIEISEETRRNLLQELSNSNR